MGVFASASLMARPRARPACGVATLDRPAPPSPILQPMQVAACPLGMGRRLKDEAPVALQDTQPVVDIGQCSARGSRAMPRTAQRTPRPTPPPAPRAHGPRRPSVCGRGHGRADSAASARSGQRYVMGRSPTFEAIGMATLPFAYTAGAVSAQLRLCGRERRPNSE